VPDLSLFLAIAEIAGVFVGFGALISLTRRSEIPISQLGQIRAVVTIGLVAMVAAVVPVVVAQYSIEARQLWWVSALVFLVLVWAVSLLSLRAPEQRQLTATQIRGRPAVAGFFWVLLEVPIQLPLILAVLNAFPDHGAAFYTTALAFNLFEAAFVLALLVYSQAEATES
jgi:hypothetical protein